MILIFRKKKYQLCKNIVNDVLEISDFEKLTEKLQDILSELLNGNDLQTAKYQFKDLIIRMGYIQENISYWEHMRELV